MLRAPAILAVAALLAGAATPALAMYPLAVSVMQLDVPYQDALVSWSGINEAGDGDWIAVCCGPPTNGTFWCR
jgi:hypothetical protein